MYDTSSRPLLCVRVMLCLATVALSGCPDAEGEDPMADMASRDMPASRDMRGGGALDMSAAPDTGDAPDASSARDMAQPDVDASTSADAGEFSDLGDLSDSRPDMPGEDMPGDMVAEDMPSAEDMAADMVVVPDMIPDMVVMDAGAPDMMADMPSDMMVDAGVDMPPAMCSVVVPQCFINDDCADASTRCEADASGIACCLPGARGTDPPGTPCVDGNACTSSLCIGDEQGGLTYCSATCASDADCFAQLPKCNAAFGVCIPAN